MMVVITVPVLTDNMHCVSIVFILLDYLKVENQAT